MSLQATRRSRATGSRDFTIITALPDEFEATCRHLSAIRREPSEEGVAIYKCSLALSNARVLRGTIIQPLATGRVEAAVAATFTILKYEPRIIAVIGIAGGFRWIDERKFPHQLQLGDVVFADRFIDTEYKKIFKDGEETRVREYFVSKDWIRWVEQYQEQEVWWEKHPSKHSADHSRYARPGFHIGAMVSASSVIARKEAQYSIQSTLRSLGQHSPILAVEMEAVGVAVAASRLGVADRVIMFRGINDYADEAKSLDEAGWRATAADNAAAAGVGFIKFFALNGPPRGHAE